MVVRLCSTQTMRNSAPHTIFAVIRSENSGYPVQLIAPAATTMKGESQMNAYRVEKQVAANGMLQLDALPFQEGELVEVIVLARERKTSRPVATSPKGKVIEYIDPTEPVAENDWGVLK